MVFFSLFSKFCINMGFYFRSLVYNTRNWVVQGRFLILVCLQALICSFMDLLGISIQPQLTHSLVCGGPMFMHEFSCNQLCQKSAWIMRCQIYESHPRSTLFQNGPPGRMLVQCLKWLFYAMTWAENNILMKFSTLQIKFDNFLLNLGFQIAVCQARFLVDENVRVLLTPYELIYFGLPSKGSRERLRVSFH